ncbi:MAG: 50S ribosomal protein L25 [candidate division Zixibacteria bacterium]|nr:50S ribosomal protein L25 [candidate division Zixibacteria bacterium]
MKEITLEVSSRENAGKGVARKLRAASKIPAIVYGKDHDSKPLVIDYDHFHTKYHSLHGENALVNLKIDGKAVDSKAMIRDMQHDPVYGDILHLDFQYIRMDQKIHMPVQVKLIGIANGVRTFSGVMQWKHRELEVLALPKDLPESIDINIEEMNIGDAIHISDLDYPNLEFVNNDTETVVSVIAPKVIQEETTEEEGEEGEEGAVEAAVEGEEQAEPEVIAEKKAEDRQTGKDKKK